MGNYITIIGDFLENLVMDEPNIYDTSRGSGKRGGEDLRNEKAKQARTVAKTDDNLIPVEQDEDDDDDDYLHINDLPHHILISILQCLSLSNRLKVGLVCRYWHSLVNDPAMWREINLKDMILVDDLVLNRLTSLSDNVTFLDISDTRGITTDGFVQVAQRCRTLHTLKVVRCDRLFSPAFAAIGQYCQTLRWLYLEGCNALTDEDLAKVSEGCRGLVKLRLGSCGKITSKGISAVANNCHLINHLCLDQCCKVNDDCLEALSMGCPVLECLSLSACSVTHDKIWMLSRCKKLRVLELARISNVTDGCIISLVKQLPCLESLNLSLCTNITDQAVEAVAKYATKLKKLHLVSCTLTDKALFHVADYSKSIECLDVGWCGRITDAGPPYISEKCKTLTSLGLMRCDKVADELMDRLVEKHPHISYSTMYLDCRRLIERARQAGHLTESETQTLDNVGESPNGE